MILVKLSGGGKLVGAAAASYERMSAMRGRPLRIVSTTRTYAEQKYLYDGYRAGKPGFNFALPPGTSVHESGLAVDFHVSEWAWLAENAKAHGWVQTNSREEWHREYRIELDRFLSVPTVPEAPRPRPILTPKDDDMATLILFLYRAYLNREPSPMEVLGWVRATVGMSTTAAEDLFKRSPAESGTVHAAYALYLGRQPSPAEVAAWATNGNTIAQVFEGIAKSPEAVN